jgi:hypothetical protein
MSRSLGSERDYEGEKENLTYCFNDDMKTINEQYEAIQSNTELSNEEKIAYLKGIQGEISQLKEQYDVAYADIDYAQMNAEGTYYESNNYGVEEGYAYEDGSTMATEQYGVEESCDNESLSSDEVSVESQTELETDSQDNESGEGME